MSKKQSNIISIGTAVPNYRYEQKTISDFMIRYFGLNEETARKLSIIYKKSAIEVRHSVLPDFDEHADSILFKSSTKNPTLSDRINVYKKEAVGLAANAAVECFAHLSSKAQKKILPVTHLITVSCTGVSAPGLDIELMKKLELPADIHRTSVNFMGCYAGFHAFKMADSICNSDEDATVLVVLTELCSLHFQPGTDNETMVVNSLFADGAAALLFTSGKKAKKIKGRQFEVIGFSGEVIHEGAEYMTWKPSENGFLMGLDALVPQVIEDNAARLVNDSLNKFGLRPEDIQHWIFHPGGKKILDAVQRAIALEEKDLHHSFRVLRDFGNMSSPSVCFALWSLLQEVKGKKREFIFAAGFGPGITIETAIFKPVVNE